MVDGLFHYPIIIPPALKHPIEFFNIQEDLYMSDTLSRLMQTHQRLDQKLRDELRRRWPDMGEIARLKKLKLAIKDKLHRRSFLQKSRA
jgi:uncharacterized protein